MDKQAKVPPHPFINPDDALHDTVRAIDALLAPVDEYLAKLCSGWPETDFDDSVKHGHQRAVEACRQIADYVSEAIDVERINRRREAAGTSPGLPQGSFPPGSLHGALDAFRHFEREAPKLSTEECAKELEKGLWRVSVPFTDPNRRWQLLHDQP